MQGLFDRRRRRTDLQHRPVCSHTVRKKHSFIIYWAWIEIVKHFRLGMRKFTTTTWTYCCYMNLLSLMGFLKYSYMYCVYFMSQLTAKNKFPLLPTLMDNKDFFLFLILNLDLDILGSLALSQHFPFNLCIRDESGDNTFITFRWWKTVTSLSLHVWPCVAAVFKLLRLHSVQPFAVLNVNVTTLHEETNHFKHFG